MEHTEHFFADVDVFDLHRVVRSNDNLIITVKRLNTEFFITGNMRLNYEKQPALLDKFKSTFLDGSHHCCGLVGWTVNEWQL